VHASACTGVPLLNHRAGAHAVLGEMMSCTMSHNVNLHPRTTLPTHAFVKAIMLWPRYANNCVLVVHLVRPEQSSHEHGECRPPRGGGRARLSRDHGVGS
jgi:hypothetical protein